MTLSLENATVVRGRRAILDRADFACAAGTFTALCGPNGAGKTTALSVLSGAVRPDAGAAMLDGRNVRAVAPGVLARRRAVVSQSSMLSFPFQVHEVVAMGRAPHQGRSGLGDDRRIIGEAIGLLDLTELAERNFMTLSGGERQRVHIARALAQIWEAPDEAGPGGEGERWLLLDEPTAALDLKHQIKLMGLLRRLAGEGWGVAAVLHDLHLVRAYADEAVLFKGGAVAGAGPAGEQLTPERVQDIFDLDAPYAMAG